MKQSYLYFRLFCKRFLKKPIFLLLLLLLPVLSVILKKVFTIDNVSMKVAVYTDDTDGICAEAVDILEQGTDIISFIRCNSEEEVTRLVAEGNCQCGYILPDHLEEIFDKNAFRGSIHVVTGTYSISPMTDEIVFSAVFNRYALYLLQNYIDDTRLLKHHNTEKIHNQISELYEEFLSNGSTFHFHYHNADAISGDSSLLLPGYLILSVRGILSVIVFAAALAGTLQLYRDRSRKIFRTLCGSSLRITEFMVILAPASLTALSSLIGILLSGGTKWWIECPAMLLYLTAVSLFCYLFSIVFKQEASFCSLIPFLIMGSLILCPVFIDITEFGNAFEILQMLLPPSWYLKVFSISFV